ncbi:MAG TPA: DUF1987 domain-containing protein [Thermotogota bacterium]|nr:DUF1987 domain-containing protein [Thermotogota bacterium]HRW34863.1 DUF1987 domain-containing protein [Thermotogota bacterium]
MIQIDSTPTSPKVYFDEKTHVFLIEGESYPENSFEFYKPVFNWFDEVFPNLDRMELHLKISYMNSSSVKCILDVMTILEEAFEAGKNVRIKWFYEPENSRSLEMAEDFKEDLDLPFEVLS